MDLRPITDRYSVAPQLEPSDMAELAKLGVTTVVCNRPDSENPAHLQAAALQEAAEKAGIAFVYNPVIGLGMSHESIDEQAEAISNSDGNVVAYCASGMRSALMWALATAGTKPTEDILAAVANAGFRMDHLIGQIEGIGRTRD